MSILLILVIVFAIGGITHASKQAEERADEKHQKLIDALSQRQPERWEE